MDVDTITALLAGLGGQIATGINQALVNGNNAGREGVGPPGRPPDFSDRHRPDTAAQILKSQQSAFDHVMENRADPDSQTITAFIQSVEEKLTSEHCKNVFKFRDSAQSHRALHGPQSTQSRTPPAEPPDMSARSGHWPTPLELPFSCDFAFARSQWCVAY